MEKKVKAFWLYTIILFSVAFVVILLSATTGLRYNDNKKESLKIYQGAQNSLMELTNENESLKKAIKESDKKNEELSLKVSAVESEKQEILKAKEEYKVNVDNLISARGFLRDGKYAEAREVFEKVNPEGLGEGLMEIYTYVQEKL